MKLYLADDEKLNVYTLPESVDESFLFSYTPTITNIEVFLNIYSDNNKWFIKCDETIRINNEIGIVELTNMRSYKLKIFGADYNYILYTYPSNNTNYTDIKLENIKNINIGRNQDNDIIYNDELTANYHASITYEDGLFYIKTTDDESFNTYINKIILTNKQILNIGDVIFINNLKIIWMKDSIRIYNTETNNITLSSALNKPLEKTLVNNEQYANVDTGENDISLYRDENYFFHKPRLTITFSEETVTIDPPPKSELKDDVPLIFTLGSGLTMLVFAGVNMTRAYTNFQQGAATLSVITPVLTSSAMVIGTFLLPKLLKSYTKKKAKEKEAYRQEKYTLYLEKKQNEINKILKYQMDTLYSNYLSSEECFEIVVGNKTRLWERELTDPDFLTVRVGLGNIPSALIINAPQEKFELEEDELITRVHNIVNNSKNLINVPVTISFCENFISSIVCNTEFEKEYIDGIILQLISMHNPKDLKIVFLTSKNNEYKWEYIKLLPHNISDNKEMRYFANNEEETKKILNEIEKIYKERKETLKEASDDINGEIKRDQYFKNFKPYYLIITDNYKNYKNIEFLNKLMEFNKNIGFSLLMVEKSMRNLPNACNKYIYVVNKTSCIFEKEYTNQKQINFETEYSNKLDMYKVARELSNIPIQTLSETYSLPISLSFLEMYNVGNIEQLSILNKWNSSNPISSLACPVGVHPSGELFKLDLHEKFHGPHGLIAGSTGSGKSEFIISYILSMAINYHPNEVQFVLIDYKGGGLAGAFENRETGIKIPHLAGTITNLDTSEMHRTLVSIESELKKRQKMFNEARDALGESTIDIYKYQRYYREGVLKTPIPHLFIISDEFAELKSQQPEFMDELISTARIGRSLGVHLILATQKPSGVVNDQIWSNSKFKVCLKVQTKADSMEMLKKPDAASIREAGRFYLQVGYDELFELGQSAYSGATYTPTEKVIKKVDDSINIINNTGDIIKSINNLTIKDNNPIIEKKGDQLTNIVKYLYDIAAKNNISTSKLWLENIPPEIYISNLAKKYNYTHKPYEINPIIGEYDDPGEQKQGLLTINITKTGNTLLYGVPGSGKENFLTTLITSICIRHSVDEVNIYIADFGAETLKKFEQFPQVGDVIFSEETEKLNNLLSILTKKIEERKELFSSYLGSYESYIKESDKKLPMILCIINGYESFIETHALLSEKFINLYKDGPKFGINFIITNALATGVRSKVLQLFNNKLTLKLSDPNDYRYLMNAPRGMEPSNHFGRGIIKLHKALEFQTAYISKPEDINKTILELSETLKKQINKKAPKIPVLPRFFTVEKFLNNQLELSNVPIGISKNKLTTCTYDFNKYNMTPIVTNNVRSHLHFLYGLIEILKQIDYIKIRIIDVLKVYNNSQGVDTFNKDYDTLIKQIKIEANKDGTRKKMNVFIIIGLGSFKNNIEDKTKKIYNDVFTNVNNYKKNKFIIIDDYNSYKSLETEPWFKTAINANNGIWIGDGGSTQLAIKMPNMTNEERKTSFNQIGYVVKETSHTIIRYIVDKEFDDEK